MLSLASPFLAPAPHPPFPEWAVEQPLGPGTRMVPALLPPKGCRSQHFERTLCRLSTPPSFVYDYGEESASVFKLGIRPRLQFVKLCRGDSGEKGKQFDSIMWKLA